MNDAEFRRRAHAVLKNLEQDRGTESDFRRCPDCNAAMSDRPEERLHYEWCGLATLLAAGPSETSAGLRERLREYRGKGPFRPNDVARAAGLSVYAVPAALRDLGAVRVSRGVWRIDG